MADKPILEVEINGSAFDAFRAKFDAYRAKAEETPLAWGKVGQETSSIVTHFEAMIANTQRVQDTLARLDEANQVRAGEENSSATAWARITHSAHQFGDTVCGTTLSLGKWAGLTGLFSSILGAGGLYGIGRMAANVSGRRTAAMGYGLTYGEFGAYETNFARLGNAGGLLAGFGDALTSAESRAPLYALMGPQADKRLAGKDAASALAEALPDIKRFVDRADPRNMQNVLRGTGMDRLGLDLNTALTIRAMSADEIGQIAAGFRSDIGPMGLPSDLALKWQDFSTQIERAGAEIETHFAERLANLAPAVEKLSKATVHFVDQVLEDGGPAAVWLEKLGKRISSFANRLNSKDFDQSVGIFLKDVGKIGDLISRVGQAKNPNAGLFGGVPTDPGQRKANRWLNWIFGTNQPEHASAPQGAASAPASRSARAPTPQTPDQRPWFPNSGMPEGAPLNYAAIRGVANQDRGQWGGIGENLVTISDPQGNKTTVNATAAPHFEGFLAELEAKGYKVTSLGGYNPRYKVGGGGWSQHAYGNAIDINPYANPFGGTTTDMPEDISVIAARYGLSWGGDWRSKKDPMHFEYTGVEPVYSRNSSEQIGQQNHVHVDDQSGAVQVEVSSMAVGPMAHGSIWRFGH